MRPLARRLWIWIQGILRTFRLFVAATLRALRLVLWYEGARRGWLFLRFVFEVLILGWWLGYGERPLRVLTVVGLILVVTWLLYWFAGTFVLDAPRYSYITGRPSYQEALYYSLISFSALGYGSWALEPTGWARWVGAVQPFFGIVSAVALSISITQRMGR